MAENFSDGFSRDTEALNKNKPLDKATSTVSKPESGEGLLRRLGDISRSPWIRPAVLLLGLEIGAQGAQKIADYSEIEHRLEQLTNETTDTIEDARQVQASYPATAELLGQYAPFPPDYDFASKKVVELNAEEEGLREKKAKFLWSKPSEKPAGLRDQESSSQQDSSGETLESHSISFPNSIYGSRYNKNGIYERAELKREDWKRAVEALLPQSWKANINTINFKFDDFPVPAEFGDVKNIAAVTSPGSGDVTFIKHAIDYPLEQTACDLVLHEAAHLNDWNPGNKYTEPVEKAALLTSILQRMAEPDQYSSSHVKSFTNPDEKLQMFFQSREYWAVISAAYFMGDPNLNYKDYAIVDGFIKKHNPGYNAQKAKAQCMEIVEGAYHH